MSFGTLLALSFTLGQGVTPRYLLGSPRPNWPRRRSSARRASSPRATPPRSPRLPAPSHGRCGHGPSSPPPPATAATRHSRCQSAARAARLTLLRAAAPLSPSIASLACGAARRPSPTSTPSSPRHEPSTALACPAPSPSSPFLLPRAELERARAACVPPAKSLASAPPSSNHSHPKLPHLPPQPLGTELRPPYSRESRILWPPAIHGHRAPPRCRTPLSGHCFLRPAAQIEAR